MSVMILSAVDDDTVPIVEAKEADVLVKAPDTFASTVFKSEAIDADVDVKAPDTLASTVSILVCREPVADCRDAVACPRVVILDCNEAVASPNVVTLLCNEPVSEFKSAN